MFGFSHIEFEWLSDAAQGVLIGTIWFFSVIGFVAGIAAIWYGLGLALGVL